MHRLLKINEGAIPGKRIDLEDENFLFTKNRQIRERIAALGGQSQNKPIQEAGDRVAVELEALREARKAIREIITESVRRAVMIKAYDVSKGDPSRYSEALQNGLLELERNMIDHFDPRLGCRFSSYVIRYIPHKMARAQRDNHSTIRIPVYTAEKRSAIERFESRFYAINGRTPEAEEISDATGISGKSIRRIKSIIYESYGCGTDEAHDTISYLPDKHTPPPDAALELIESGRPVAELISRLSERQRRIISMRFGFDSRGGLTLQQVADRLGLSRERIRQIEVKALSKLRLYIEIESRRGVHLTMHARPDNQSSIPHPQDIKSARCAAAVPEAPSNISYKKTQREKRPGIYERIERSYSEGEPLRGIADREGLEYAALLKICKKVRDDLRRKRRDRARLIVAEALGEDGIGIFDSIDGKVPISDVYIDRIELGFKRVSAIIGFMARNDIVVLDGMGHLYFP